MSNVCSPFVARLWPPTHLVVCARCVYVHYVEQVPSIQTCNANLLTQPHVSAPESVPKHTLFPRLCFAAGNAWFPPLFWRVHVHAFTHRICVCSCVFGDGSKLRKREGRRGQQFRKVLSVSFKVHGPISVDETQEGTELLLLWVGVRKNRERTYSDICSLFLFVWTSAVISLTPHQAPSLSRLHTQALRATTSHTLSLLK